MRTRPAMRRSRSSCPSTWALPQASSSSSQPSSALATLKPQQQHHRSSAHSNLLRFHRLGRQRYPTRRHRRCARVCQQPDGRAFSRVNKKLSVPVYSIILCMFIQMALNSHLLRFLRRVQHSHLHRNTWLLPLVRNATVFTTALTLNRPCQSHSWRIHTRQVRAVAE